MEKLWDKGYQLDALMESFTVGDDPKYDQELLFFDCVGSLAHAKMLNRIGILSKEEWKHLQRGLSSLISDGLCVNDQDEDVHTAVEKALGESGKKLHTARSRNDQIALDLRLWAKDQLLKVSEIVVHLCKALKGFALQSANIPIPGRTHMQHAMPSSLGLWAGAFLESLIDDLNLLKGAYELIDQSPLGSAAGYGVALPIDRAFVSEALGFKKVQNNVLYVSNSRGKFEAAIVHALCQIMNDLSKLAADIIFFSLPEVGYFSLPQELCSGSSLMPQKRNPDPLELIRAKAATLSASLIQILEISRGLPSGYHRDFQETKGPFMESMKTAVSATGVMERIICALQVNEERCTGAFSKELFATDTALKLTEKGIPFREAYQHIALHPGEIASETPQENIANKTHLGATGNLGLELTGPILTQFKGWIEDEKVNFQEKVHALITEETK